MIKISTTVIMENSSIVYGQTKVKLRFIKHKQLFLILSVAIVSIFINVSKVIIVLLTCMQFHVPQCPLKNSEHEEVSLK